MLTTLTLGVLQIGIAVYVRNIVHDAAVEGAHVAALADTTHAEGAARTRRVIDRALGAAFAETVSVTGGSWLGHPSVEVRVTGRLPVIGMLGPAGSLEVSAHAPVESFG